MRRLLLVIALSACGRVGFDHASDFDGAWTELDGSASGGGVSQTTSGQIALGPAIAVGPDGVVYVAWFSDASGPSEIYLRAWEGNAWFELGGSASGQGMSALGTESKGIGLDVASAGRPEVTWMHFDGVRSIYQRVWDGGAWVERAGSATARGISKTYNPWWPDAIVADGTTVVAYENYNAPGVNGGVHVRKLTTNGWDEIAGSATGAGVTSGVDAARNADLAATSNGFVVAWTDFRDADTDIELVRHDGSAWVGLGGSFEVGGVSRTDTDSERPSVIETSKGLAVLWRELTPAGGRVYLRRFENGAWVELGGSATGDGISGPDDDVTYSAIGKARDGSLLVVWHGVDIHVARFDEATRTWSRIGDAELALPGDAGLGNIATGPDGTIYLVWEQTLDDTTQAIYLRALR